MLTFLEHINGFVWGIPALIFILCIGMYLTVGTGFAQVRLFPAAIKSFLRRFVKRDKMNDEVSPFQALCTALAATVGTGNLAGVAGAICLGGPGAVFWIWVSGFLGMVTKFAEATLATRFYFFNEHREKVGGPMYMIRLTMGKNWQWLASVYCFFGIAASFGVGNATQVNTVVAGINQACIAVGLPQVQIRNFFIGVLLAVLVLSVLLGGAKRIGRVAEVLVPFGSIVYLFFGIVIIVMNLQYLPSVCSLIVKGAFTPRAVTGGMIGSAFTVLRTGIARGVFTNEAGMGTASIAHAGAKVNHPVEQGLMGIIEVFLDTIVICTVTAFVILCSGVTVPFGTDEGIVLTTKAFSNVLGEWTSVLIALLLCIFAFATILGWGLYGIRCTQYLFGEHSWKKFVWLQGVFAVVGAVLDSGTVWILSDIMNGLMVVPNLIVLLYLSPELIRLLKQYKSLTERSGS